MASTGHPFHRCRFAALAHRGGSLLAANVGRENTVAAFRAAEELGYRYFETDVHLTRDGVLVAFHDADLSRVTGRTGTIAELTQVELGHLRVGGEPIPTMDELFETFPQARFNIDLKTPAATDSLVETIRRHRALNRVNVGSFTSSTIARYRTLIGPGAATACAPAEIWRLFAPSAIATRLPRAGQVLQVPESYRVAGRTLGLISPHSISRAHRQGLKVHVWTIDDHDSMHRLIDWGVDGLVSDAIDVLKAVLIERGLWDED